MEWLMPVILSLWEAKVGGSLEPKSLRQYGETSLYKEMQKLARHGGTCLLFQLLGRLRWEDCFSPRGGGCNEPRSCHCTPAWVTEHDSVSKKKTSIVSLYHTTPSYLHNSASFQHFTLWATLPFSSFNSINSPELIPTSKALNGLFLL